MRRAFRSNVRLAVFAGATGAGALILPISSLAAIPPSGKVAKQRITVAELLAGRQPKSLTVNSRFAAPARAERALSPFIGTLRLGNVKIRTITTAKKGFPSAHQLGKDASIFPDVSLSFFTRGSGLVPTTQDVIRNGVLKSTKSFWDVIVQPGAVWSQRGDHGWSRASFPFALVNSIEGETHNGIALFAYRGHRVTDLRFQIVQETAPYLIADYFSGWGAAPTRYATLTKAQRQAIPVLSARYARSVRMQYPTKPWSALKAKVGAKLLSGFNEAPRTSTSILQDALLVKGTLYRTACPTSAGSMPYCDNVRYGVWSVTKSAVLAMGLFRLAEKYGDSIMDEPIATYVPQARTPSWSDVTFRDLSLMASGHGATTADPTCYLCDYSRWYVARSEKQKTTEALNYPRFAEPGTVYNYRDQDAYLLGVAEESLLRAKAGARASLVSMLQNEVYAPIGIQYLPNNRTVDPKGPGHTMGAYGYYPTLDDLAKLGTLISNHGASHGKQILSAGLVGALLGSPTPPAGSILQSPLLPSGKPNEVGPLYYLSDFHMQPVAGAAGCTVYVPVMDGWGGDLAAPLPNGTVGIRIANELNGGTYWDSAVGMAKVSDKLSRICR